MPSYKVVWSGERSDMGLIADLLSEVHYPPADAVSLVKNDTTKEDAYTDWRSEAYFSSRPDVAALDDFLAGAGINTTANLEELADQDWVANSLDGLGIVRCGRFVLYGTHDQDKLSDQPDDISICIDANQAFGTGHHPTTAGCLEVLDTLADQSPENILDLGTGSAVLAIAAAKLWQSSVLATDIDPTSVEIAQENADKNNVPGISFCTADGFDHEDISVLAPFDFIFANILAGPLVELAPEIARHSKTGATVVLAGLLGEQEANVTTAYAANGFDLIHRHHHNTWPVLVYKKT